MVMENYGKSAQRLRRTARGHWCFRCLGNCCATKVAERGSMEEAEPLKKKKSFSQKISEKLKRKSQEEKDEANKESSGAVKTSDTPAEKKKLCQPPAPPRYPPPSLHYNDWHCPNCNFFNEEKEHPYAHTCAQCGKRRPRHKDKLKVSLVG